MLCPLLNLSGDRIGPARRIIRRLKEVRIPDITSREEQNPQAKQRMAPINPKTAIHHR